MRLKWFPWKKPSQLQERPSQRRIGVHVLLFVLTALSTYFVGSGNGPIDALWYSLGIMSILLAHEMGHYLMARKYGVPVTLPYFIPFPISIFGTMGAVIKMGGQIQTEGFCLISAWPAPWPVWY